MTARGGDGTGAAMNTLSRPHSACVLRLSCTEAEARAISDLLTEMLDPLGTAVAAFEAKATTEHWNEVPWAVEVFFGSAPDEAMVLELVGLAAGPELASRASFGRIAERDWVAASLEGLSAVRAGRFLVHGSHARAQVRANDIGLEIEAALAFGTGHHGTTRGCLLMLDRVLKQRRPARILDIGAGTGVLAIAAARALRVKVAAGDIDAISVKAARANARLNGAGQFVAPVKAAGLRHPRLAARRLYDLAFANILAKPLRVMAADLAAAMAGDGEIILSGLLAGDVNGVLSAYRWQGFRLVSRLDLEGWATLLLRR